MTGARQGNYIVFFPSYQYMAQVAEVFERLNDGEADCLMQTNGMREKEREEFLAEFEKKRERSLIAFCVMGGIFGEGIDLKNDRLIGTLIVGTGLPQLSDEREILKDYYDRREGDGFAYAYRYPGMNKVQQAAGRVIRTAEDVGVIALLDERFLNRENRDLFPREWEQYEICSLRNVEACVKRSGIKKMRNQTSGRSFKNSSVAEDVGRFGLILATRCLTGMGSLVFKIIRSLDSLVRQ